MIVTRLKLANLRAIEAAEFRFQPGFNLIVGVNGVGKTSVLHALAVCLSAMTKRANGLRGRAEGFASEAIRVGAEALTVECVAQINQRDHTYLIHKPRAASAPQKRKVGMPREQVYATPERGEFLREAPSPVSGKELGGRPLAVLFSTNRAVPTERAPAKGVAAGGVAAAFADAFAARELRLGEFATWMRVQRALKKERSASRRVLTAFEEAVARFLPGYSNLRLDGENGRELWIDHGASAIPVRQLSDGERGTLALVLDLTRRLAQANPALADPAADASAVVLIDEIDLHLHPTWQRQIVYNLQSTFPQCQFIATTHSPFVVQSLQAGQLINLDPKEIGEYADKSIEDIAENVMGVEVPQKSERYLRMMSAAQEYFHLLRSAETNGADLAAAERRLNELSEPFSDDPAFQALLRLERERVASGAGDETN